MRDSRPKPAPARPEEPRFPLPPGVGPRSIRETVREGLAGNPLRRARRVRLWLWVAIVLLAGAHHDFWYWDDDRLVFGVLPVGMAYHILYSIAAAALWLAALRWAWPDDLDEWAAGVPPTDEGSARR